MISKREKEIVKTKGVNKVRLPICIVILQIVLWIVIGISILIVHIEVVNKIGCVDTEATSSLKINSQ